MKLNKLGDCLSYGLTHELLDKKQSLGLSYFKTVIVYMFIKKYMCRETVRKIKKIIDIKQYSDANSNVLFEKILRLVASELKKHMAFSTVEEMFDSLNKAEIPKWVYYNCDKLYTLLPEVCWIGEKLFYVEHREHVYILNEIRVEAIRGNSLSNDEMDEDDAKEISYAYSGIIGSNETIGILYLQSVNLSDMYVEYYVESKQARVHRNKCLGMIGNMLVIEDKGFITFKAGKKLNIIKRIDAFEKYELVENEIYVTPRKEKPVYFKPYRLSLTGSLISVSYSEAKEYLWEEIKNEQSSFLKRFMTSSMIEEELEEFEFDEFSLKNVETYFQKRNDLECDRNARVCYFLTKVLSKYLNEDVDMLDYFYMFMDVSKRLEKHTWNSGLSERLYWRVEELETCGELSDCIYNLEKFKVKLLEEAYWDDRQLLRERDAISCKGKIGEFEVAKGNIDATTANIIEGIYFGNVFLYSPKGKKGTVSYDEIFNRYTIRYPRILNNSEIERIVNTFDLNYEDYHIIVEENSVLVN